MCTENNGVGMLMCDDLCVFPVELFCMLSQRQCRWFEPLPAIFKAFLFIICCALPIFFQMIFNRFCPFSFAWIDMVWLTKSSLVWKRFFLCHILHTSHWDWNGRVQWESACVKQLLTWAFFSLNNKQSTGSCNYAAAPLVAGAKIKGGGKGGKGSIFWSVPGKALPWSLQKNPVSNN